VSQLASRRSSQSKLGTLDEDSTIKTVMGFAVFCPLASSPVAESLRLSAAVAFPTRLAHETFRISLPFQYRKRTRIYPELHRRGTPETRGLTRLRHEKLALCAAANVVWTFPVLATSASLPVPVAVVERPRREWPFRTAEECETWTPVIVQIGPFQAEGLVVQ